MYAGALDAESDAQVDAGPFGVWLPAVAAGAVPWDGHDPLQGALSLQTLLPGLGRRV